MPSQEHAADHLSSPQATGGHFKALDEELRGFESQGSEAHVQSEGHPRGSALPLHAHFQIEPDEWPTDDWGDAGQKHRDDTDEGECRFSRCSIDGEAKGWQAHFSGSREEEPPSLLPLLPSLSFLPPLLHRYTGTTTESLLVGVTCCVINIALYITSGVLTRVLQQQEHVATPQAPQGEHLPSCSSHAAQGGSTDCMTAPEVVVEHLRVPYMMVWLPLACQVVFLFLALASIKKKYHFRVARHRGRPSAEQRDGVSVALRLERRGAPSRLLQEQLEADVETVSPLESAATTSRAPLSGAEEDEEIIPGEASAELSPYLGEHRGALSDRHSSRGESSPRRTSPQDAIETYPNVQEAQQCFGILSGAYLQSFSSACWGACWLATGELYKSRVYDRYLEDYYVSVQAFLREELKYESLGKLVSACFLVVCLYISQGWFWSIAVGTTGMSICSVTAIYSTNSLFVFLFTSLIYKEGADDFIQMISLILATVGVALIAYESQGEPQSSTGVILSICSSATYGLFEVLYKMYLLQNRSNHPLTFVFFVSGLMGALALIFLWVPMPVLHALGWETFPSSPPPFLALFLLALSCVCSSAYIILLQISLMLLPSPMLVAMCFLLSLPPAAASDALRGGGGGVGGSGCAFIAFSLLITGIKEWNIKEREEEQGPTLGDLCMPFASEAEARLSTDLTSEAEQPTSHLRQGPEALR